MDDFTINVQKITILTEKMHTGLQIKCPVLDRIPKINNYQMLKIITKAK
jgi:hypothetical protein